MLKSLAKLLSIPIVAILTMSGYNITPSEQMMPPFYVEDIQLGADLTIPVGLATYNLSGAGISSSASSITLASLTIPQTGQPLLDADFSDTFYITIEPGSRKYQEFVSCTTVSGNTLSGCSRGLSPISPYTASTTLQFAHSGGSQVIFSNSPQFYNEFAMKDNDETITGDWTFGGTWTFSTSPTLTTDCTGASANTAICAKAYIDGVAVAGASDANETTKGIIELATQAELYASTSVGSTGARLVLPLTYATTTNGWSGGLSSTPLRSPQPGAYIPITDPTTGQLDPSLVNFTFAYEQANTINGAITYTATTTFATTTATKGIFGTTAPYMTTNPILYVSGDAYITGGLGIGTTATTTDGNLVVSGTASTTNLVVSGTCTNCATNGYEIKTDTFNMNGGSPSSGSGSVSCTAGKKVVGGGASGITTILSSSVDSYPSSNTAWSVSITGGNGEADTVTMYAICVTQ